MQSRWYYTENVVDHQIPSAVHLDTNSCARRASQRASLMPMQMIILQRCRGKQISSALEWQLAMFSWILKVPALAICKTVAFYERTTISPCVALEEI